MLHLKFDSTYLLDFILLHEREELKDKSRQTEEEIDEFMDDERAPGGDLEFAVVLQHVVPRVLQRFLQRIFWKKRIHIFHRQICRRQNVSCAVHLHGSESVGLSE